MGNREEPQYKTYEYRCPHCGVVYYESGAVKKHPNLRICPICHRKASDR